MHSSLIHEDPHLAHLSVQDLQDLFRVNDAELRASATQRQLAELSPGQRPDCAHLTQHFRSLQGLPHLAGMRSLSALELAVLWLHSACLRLIGLVAALTCKATDLRGTFACPAEKAICGGVAMVDVRPKSSGKLPLHCNMTSHLCWHLCGLPDRL